MYICIIKQIQMETFKNILAVIIFGAVFIASMLIGSYAHAQTWDGTHIYLPKYTKHYVTGDLYATNSYGSEGGSKGFVLTRSKNGLHFTMGYMENSYGDFSHYSMFGVSVVETKRSQLSFHIGLANNYSKAYYNERVREKLYRVLPYSMAYNSMLPIGTVTYKHRITKHVGVQANINPIFVNTGLYIQL